MLFIVGEDYRAHAVAAATGRALWRTAGLGAKLEGTPALDEGSGTVFVG